MYRIWDSMKKCWLKNDIYVTPQIDIVQAIPYKKRKPDIKKLTLLSERKFICHLYTNVTDKNKVGIYEGDILKFNDEIIGVVTYISNSLSFLLLDYKEKKYYELTEQICNQCEVAGNVCENGDFILPDVGK